MRQWTVGCLSRQPTVAKDRRVVVKSPNSQIKLSLNLYIPLIRGFRGKMEWGSRLHVGTPPVPRDNTPLFMVNSGGEDVVSKP